MVDDRLAAAFTPPRPGRLVRWLGPFSPGVRATADQIQGHAAHWSAAAEGVFGAPRVLVGLGDSLAQGIGATDPNSGWFGLLAARLVETSGAEVGTLNLSRSGARVRDVLTTQLPAFEAVRDDLADPAPLVVCTVGSNDLLRGSTPGRLARDLHRLHRRLPPGAVVCTLPEPGSLSARVVNRRLRADAAEAGLGLVDVNTVLTTWRGHYAGDRFHPNEAGHRHWFEVFSAGLGLDARD